MSFRVCVCCGGTIRERGDVYSRNPNLCASCSSLTDGMPDSSLSGFPESIKRTVVRVDSHPAAVEPVKSVARR